MCVCFFKILIRDYNIFKIGIRDYALSPLLNPSMSDKNSTRGTMDAIYFYLPFPAPVVEQKEGNVV
jgi:hypothetical protein